MHFWFPLFQMDEKKRKKKICWGKGCIHVKEEGLKSVTVTIGKKHSLNRLILNYFVVEVNMKSRSSVKENIARRCNGLVCLCVDSYREVYFCLCVLAKD